MIGRTAKVTGQIGPEGATKERYNEKDEHYGSMQFELQGL